MHVLTSHQFCAGCTGLQVDIDRIREDNEHRTDVERKAGLIIWSGRRHALLTAYHDDRAILLGHFECCANRGDPLLLLSFLT